MLKLTCILRRIFTIMTFLFHAMATSTRRCQTYTLYQFYSELVRTVCTTLKPICWSGCWENSGWNGFDSGVQRFRYPCHTKPKRNENLRSSLRPERYYCTEYIMGKCHRRNIPFSHHCFPGNLVRRILSYKHTTYNNNINIPFPISWKTIYNVSSFLFDKVSKLQPSWTSAEFRRRCEKKPFVSWKKFRPPFSR